MTTKRELAYLVVGIGLGVSAPKLIPKLKPVKIGMYYKEVLKARMRLSKILIEEYYRIDDAIQAEEAFLRMIQPEIKHAPNISFEVRDEGGQRTIHLSVDYNLKNS